MSVSQLVDNGTDMHSVDLRFRNLTLDGSLIVNDLDVVNLTVDNISSHADLPLTFLGNGGGTDNHINMEAVDGILLKTNTGTPSLLDYYEVGSFTVSFTGPWNSPPLTVFFTRIGNVVILLLSGYNAAASANANISSAIGAIPARLILTSTVNVIFPLHVVDNGTLQTNMGVCQILNNGQINIFKNGSMSGGANAFTIGASGSGFSTTSLIYSI